ncbi:uncharacterized protein NPIL_353591 [Nephila pilipes]|uniref:Uncharacterized protein n=1 Tax=Nephila pilipes TaxID=299642 RepID=A0A8X6QBS6_NEPPI|nr:uncharacterized protein NPIL_596211 [Nephila pilipes]GFT48121.1 uncharacterized protein NPIL_360401 [Nephila pilipes]GFU04371.1 uncharacterized protein NPIL_609471 [Nephila pilipes]GFU10318.1 uncharacterized protein NPIL_353591 [Nephila pilipes]
MTHCSRKRPRPCDEDCCELMPISKRINDLHIRSGFPESSTSLNEIPEMHPRIQTPREILNGNLYMPDLHRHNVRTKDPNASCNYNPELNAVQNPYYYHMNGVLYEAHIQRMQRLSRPL